MQFQMLILLLEPACWRKSLRGRLPENVRKLMLDQPGQCLADMTIGQTRLPHGGRLIIEQAGRQDRVAERAHRGVHARPGRGGRQGGRRGGAADPRHGACQGQAEGLRGEAQAVRGLLGDHGGERAGADVAHGSGRELVKRRKKVSDVPEDSAGADDVYGTEEEMAERAAEGYFVCDPERNLVHCPGGEILRQKCVKSNGYIRYANKSACRHCKDRNKCIHGSGGWKEIDFSKDCLEKPCKGWSGAEGKEPGRRKAAKRKWHFERVKVVRLFLRPDRGKTAERMCLSEHPFGTIKRAMGSAYFLPKGMRKVTGGVCAHVPGVQHQAGEKPA